MLRVTYDYLPYGLYNDGQKTTEFITDSIEWCYAQQDKCSGNNSKDKIVAKISYTL